MTLTKINVAGGAIEHGERQLLPCNAVYRRARLLTRAVDQPHHTPQATDAGAAPVATNNAPDVGYCRI